MTLLKSLLLSVLFTLTNCATTISQPSNEWILIGEKIANYGLDRDIMLVNSNLVFTKIKVRVINGKVLMRDMKVEFGDGQVIDVPLRYVFDEGGYSRDIQLPGGYRHIIRISFLYETSNLSFDKAIVQVWGTN